MHPYDVDADNGRTTVRVLVRRLTHLTTTRLVPSLHLIGKTVVLDLTRLQFVEPFGLVYLYLYVRRLLTLGAQAVELHIPRWGGVGTYLRRMELCDLVEQDPRVRVLPRRGISFRSDLRDRLIELSVHPLEHEDDAYQLAQQLLDLAIYDRREDLKHLQEILEFSLSEVIANAVVHSSRAAGPRNVIVAAQTYEESRVSLAIADEGIGIPERLRLHGIVEAPLPDVDAIQKALEPMISTRPGGGGMGLTTLSDRVREIGQHLTIRSGRGQVTVLRGGKNNRQGTCDPLPGTIVEIAW
ncbi:MAG: ATP-binding protein [Longimicrobiales bacterium]